MAEQPNYESIIPPPERILLYRGAWQEWDISICRSIVLISPSQAEEKKLAILKHQSQKDNPLYPGEDSREFWQRSQ